ncbi:glycosyltransferase family 2 protein [Oenococcus oeni]|uniref:glycosyltransferase family 2 protein n=1 Tax=Oenococcus oeni TaxID=1247 RepID=UPI0021B2AE9F|nr:glycosyltransferase [Oenococcus oeni]
MILHYLVADETIQCVDSILANIEGEISIIVVDNSSPNGSFNELREHYARDKRVFLIKNSLNSGYAGGINFGYNFAKKKLKPDFIVAMNNDMTILQHDFFKKIIEIFNRTNFFVLGPDIYSTETKKHQNPENRTIITLQEVNQEISNIKKSQSQQLRLRLKSLLRKSILIQKTYYKSKRLLKRYHYIDHELENITLHGSCYIFSRKFIIARGYALYPGTTFYCEAQILDYECKRDGMKQIYSPEISIQHHEDIATNAVEGGYYQKMNMKYERMLESLKIFKELILKDQRK